MFDLLWLIPALPLAGFCLLAMFGGRMSRAVAGTVGVGSVGVSALITILIGIEFLTTPPAGSAFTQVLWSWIPVGSFNPAIAFRLDALSLLMIFVVTFVSFLIHLYSSEFMADDEGFSRFFAYMNLFVANMLVLVLADNLLLLYLGWEGVGLCSYLLIGFWYRDPANGYAARKAFVVTRVGDTAMIVALFLLYLHFGTLDIQEILRRAPFAWPVGSGTVVAVAALLLGGAVGKSAQLPLQTWLPDAMAGPTPVSALIHASTMVTAGVYLIARTHILFALAPVVQGVVAAVGAITLLISGFSALTQSDIKRVLAYSTISQIGYMFLALGVGAYSAAMFHFMTHAFFKALLFLAAGVIIHCLHHEHNMFRMGGLRKLMPTTFWTFLIGGSSLAALPLVTAGFYSKDLIIWDALASPVGSAWLWLAGIAGALLTSVYTFRMIFVTFFGEPKGHLERKPGLRLHLPLVVLAVLSVIGGFVETPEVLGHVTVFSGFLSTVFSGISALRYEPPTELLSEVLSAVLALGGIGIAYYYYVARPQAVERLMRGGMGRSVHAFWFKGWGFDQLYDLLFVRPYLWVAQANKNDIVDAFYTGIAALSQYLSMMLRRTQTGRIRTYAAGIALGGLLLLGWVVLH